MQQGFDNSFIVLSIAFVFLHLAENIEAIRNILPHLLILHKQSFKQEIFEVLLVKYLKYSIILQEKTQQDPKSRPNDFPIHFLKVFVLFVHETVEDSDQELLSFLKVQFVKDELPHSVLHELGQVEEFLIGFDTLFCCLDLRFEVVTSPTPLLLLSF